MILFILSESGSEARGFSELPATTAWILAAKCRAEWSLLSCFVSMSYPSRDMWREGPLPSDSSPPDSSLWVVSDGLVSSDSIVLQHRCSDKLRPHSQRSPHNLIIWDPSPENGQAYKAANPRASFVTVGRAACTEDESRESHVALNKYEIRCTEEKKKKKAKLCQQRVGTAASLFPMYGTAC